MGYFVLAAAIGVEQLWLVLATIAAIVGTLVGPRSFDLQVKRGLDVVVLVATTFALFAVAIRFWHTPRLAVTIAVSVGAIALCGLTAGRVGWNLAIQPSGSPRAQRIALGGLTAVLAAAGLATVWPPSLLIVALILGGALAAFLLRDSGATRVTVPATIALVVAVVLQSTVLQPAEVGWLLVRFTTNAILVAIVACTGRRFALQPRTRSADVVPG